MKKSRAEKRKEEIDNYARNITKVKNARPKDYYISLDYADTDASVSSATGTTIQYTPRIFNSGDNATEGKSKTVRAILSYWGQNG